ncbi:AAA family ATPase [Thermoproteota archaeon]
MILKSLQLENIRSYTDERLSFPEGSLMLSGDVGAGKSSILLAVEFALFGLLKGQLSGDSLLRNGAKQGSVMLKIGIEGKEVTIKRVLKRGKQGIGQDTGFIIIDGMKTEATPVELKTKVMDLIGYPKDLLTKSKLIYRYTVYTPQEEMRHILNEDRELRLDTLRKVFGVDKYKRIIENSGMFIKDLKAKRRILGEKTRELPQQRKERAEKIGQLDELKKKEEAIEPKIIEVKNLIENKKEDMSKIEKKMREKEQIERQTDIQNLKLEENTTRFQRNKEEISLAEEAISKIQEKIIQLKIKEIRLPDELIGKEEEQIERELEEEGKALLKVSEELLKLDERLHNTQQVLDGMQKDIKIKTEMTSELARKRQAYGELQEAIKDKERLKQDVEYVEKELETTLKRITELETHKKTSRQMIDEIARLTQCPTCFQDVSPVHKQKIRDEETKKLQTHADVMALLVNKRKELHQRKDESKRLIDDLHQKEKDIERIKTELDNITSTNKEVIELQKRFSKLGMEQINIETRKKELGEQDIKAKKNNLEERKDFLKDIKENNFRLRENTHLKNALDDKEKHAEKMISDNKHIKETIKGINSEKIRLKQELSEFEEIQKEYEQADDEKEKLLLKERQLAIAMAEFRKESEGVKNILKMIEDTITRLMLDESKLERLALLQDWLEKHFIGLVANMEKHVMLRAYNEFNEMFSKWFGMLIEDETISVRLDEQFSPIIVQNGYETDVSNLSGGEKTSVALAYRLALNKVINDVVGDIKTKNIIILDEPTDGFSSFQLDKIKDVLEELSIKQVVIVSHESKIESFVENILRVNKHEHVSRVI